jgi:hypothetical protein
VEKCSAERRYDFLLSRMATVPSGPGLVLQLKALTSAVKGKTGFIEAGSRSVFFAANDSRNLGRSAISPKSLVRSLNYNFQSFLSTN